MIFFIKTQVFNVFKQLFHKKTSYAVLRIYINDLYSSYRFFINDDNSKSYKNILSQTMKLNQTLTKL